MPLRWIVSFFDCKNLVVFNLVCRENYKTRLIPLKVLTLTVKKKEFLNNNKKTNEASMMD